MNATLWTVKLGAWETTVAATDTATLDDIAALARISLDHRIADRAATVTLVSITRAGTVYLDARLLELHAARSAA